MARRMGRQERWRGIVSVYGEATYQERIAPRVRDFWTFEEIYALED